MYRLCAVALVVALTGVSSGLAQDKKLEVTVSGGKEDAKNVPIRLPLEVPAPWAKANHVSLQALGSKDALIGQWTAPGIITEGIPLKDKTLVRRDLHFVLPLLKAGSTMTFALEPVNVSDTSKEFHWKENKGEYTELWRGTQPIFRYMYKAYDNSSETNRNKTYKVFHHLFEPNGTRFVTNGGDTDPENAVKKLYPHHRGLMFAVNKITQFDAKGNQITYLDEKGKKVNTFDTWHAKPKDTHESHEAFLNSEAGQVLGRHRVGITWHDPTPTTKVFAKEEREMTVYAVDGGTLVEFATRLKTAGGKVKLDGDPQHSGFQFRAHNDVSEKNTAKQTYYLRPDGKGKPGDTRNWDPKNKGPINLPWDVMSFVLYGQRFSVAYLDHPNNPGEKRYSERDYGRFGCYFEYELTPDHPLVLNHRIWLQNGEMTEEQVKALSSNFAAPPKVAAK